MQTIPLLNMNFISVLSCFGLLLAAATAQLPKPCVTPPLMTGDMSVFSNGSYMTTGSLTYDAYGQKIRTTSFGSMGNQSFVVDQLMLFREKVYYEIDWQTFTCQKKPLDASFVPMHVPEDAEMMGQYILGSSSSWGMGLLVNNWYGNLPGNATYITTFTDIGCIPLTTSVFGPDTEMIFVSTFNWVIGISDPSDLSPPSFCSKAQVEQSATPDNFFTALASLAMKAQRTD
ncbi:ependymin-like [Gouania willdenowi]|nr:ependymin-like [Gouania willdenowi]